MSSISENNPSQRESTTAEDATAIAPIEEWHVSLDISERAPTKDRPDPTYGTSTHVSFRFSPTDPAYTTEAIRERMVQLHAALEDAAQAEITRRRFQQEAAKMGIPGDPINGLREPDDVPF